MHLSFFPLKHPCPVNQLVIKKIIYIYFVAGTVALNSAFSWFSSYPDYFDLRIFPANCPPVHFNLYCLNAHCWVSLWPFWKVFHHTIINVKYWCTQNGTHTHTHERQLDIDMGLDRGICYTFLLYHCLPLAKEDCKCPWWSVSINTTWELN